MDVDAELPSMQGRSPADFSSWVAEQQKLLSAAADDPTKVRTKDDLRLAKLQAHRETYIQWHCAGVVQAIKASSHRLPRFQASG